MPTTVEEAWETKPPVKVERPATLKVEPSASVPAESVPIVEVFALSEVDVAAPRYEIPETVSAVDEAYGNWDATVVEVATT